MMSATFIRLEDSSSIYNRTAASMAAFLGYEACSISQSGYTANVGLIQSLSVGKCPVYIDEKAHMSFWDGIRSSGAQGIPFRHNEMDDLRAKTRLHGPGIIVVDSLYSGYGTFCPLEELCALKEDETHVLVVDESHSLGIYGHQGAGYCDMLGCTKRVDFITASLSKAFGTRAGIIVGDRRSILFIRETSIPAIFSSVVSVKDLLRIDQVREAIMHADAQRSTLLHMSELLRKSLPIVQTQYPSPIICIIYPTEAETREMQYRLQKSGIFAAVFCKPATRLHESCIRFTIHSDITTNDVDRILSVLWRSRV